MTEKLFPTIKFDNEIDLTTFTTAGDMTTGTNIATGITFVPEQAGPFVIEADDTTLGTWGYDSYGYDSYGYDFDGASWSAWESSNSWDAIADDYWTAGDMTSYWASESISQDMSWYSSSMEYLAEDPTDWSAWSDAYESANSASWDAWDQSVDAYAAGDYEAAAYWESVSDDYTSTANSTWSAWDTTYDASYSSSSYDTSSSASLISDYSYDY